MNNKILKLFSDFISIQSVSTDQSRHDQILKAVGFLKKEIELLGFKINIYQTNNCPPLIIARKFISSSTKTIGVYAHYDVQPEDPLEKWNSPPFELTLRNEKFFGRGVADDKGHMIQILEAIRKLTRLRQDSGGQGNNIVLIFEGEEEVGSQNFEELINQAKKDLENIDAFYILDFGMETSDQPEIFFGLRGLIGFEIEIRIGEKDLHSGVYGNRVYNSINVLTELLSKIKDPNSGMVLIPGFYDHVRKPTKKEWKNLIRKKQTDQDFIKEAGVYKSQTINKKYPWLSTKIYPSFDINGITGGYTGPGVKTIIPAIAQAKFSFRLIENQTPSEIEKLVNDFIRKNLPEGIKYSLKTLGKLDPFYTDIDNKYVKTTDKIFTNIFGKQSLFTRSGGSIGAAATLAKLFNKPLILTGFTLADCNIHSPNENFDSNNFFKGIEVLKKLFSQ